MFAAQENQEGKHTPLMEPLIDDKIASADSLSDDAAFRQLEAEAAAPPNGKFSKNDHLCQFFGAQNKFKKFKIRPETAWASIKTKIIPQNYATS